MTLCDYSVLFDKLLHSAPPHFLETVISELDCHSIRALLLAAPKLRPWAVILRSDHMSSSSQFFRIPDVPVLSLESVLLEDRVVERHRFIRLIEHADTMGPLQILTRRLYNQTSIKSVLNSCSFVHLSGVISIEGVHSLLETGCGRKLCLHIGPDYNRDVPKEAACRYYKTWIKLHCGQSIKMNNYVRTRAIRAYTSGPRNSLIRWCLFKSDINPDHPYHWRGIEELSISNTMVVENLRLQRLSKLVITFYKDKEGRIPIVRAIDAPMLFAFRVDFPGGRVPLFYDMSVGSYFTMEAHFSLCNPEALDPYGTFKDTWTSAEDYAMMDLSFTSNFEWLMFAGVPDSIVHQADMVNTIELTWYKTVEFTLMRPIARDAVIMWFKMCSLTLVCSIPDSWAPRFDLHKEGFMENLLWPREPPPDEPYGSVYILATAPRFDLNGLLDIDVLWKHARYISVVCRVPEKLNYPTNAIVLSHRTLKQLVSNTGPLASVIFKGCLFGRDNELLRIPILPEPTPWLQTLNTWFDQGEEREIQELCIQFVDTDERETLVVECLSCALAPVRVLHVGHDARDTSRCKTLQITLPGGEGTLRVVDDAGVRTGFSEVRVLATLD